MHNVTTKTSKEHLLEILSSVANDNSKTFNHGDVVNTEFTNSVGDQFDLGMNVTPATLTKCDKYFVVELEVKHTVVGTKKGLSSSGRLGVFHSYLYWDKNNKLFKFDKKDSNSGYNAVNLEHVDVLKQHILTRTKKDYGVNETPKESLRTGTNVNNDTKGSGCDGSKSCNNSCSCSSQEEKSIFEKLVDVVWSFLKGIWNGLLNIFK